jgi:hypothetical protein
MLGNPRINEKVSASREERYSMELNNPRKATFHQESEEVND